MAKRKGRNGGELYSWEPGQSGNPTGPKPGYKQSKTILKRLLAISIVAEHPITKELAEISVAEALHLRMLGKALSEGDLAIYREVLDRVEGRTDQGLKLKDAKGGTLGAKIIYKLGDGTEFEF